MAFPWQIVITAIPWKQVIENAPKLVEGAQNLFLRTRKDKAPADIPDEMFTDGNESEQLRQMEKLIREHRGEIQALHRDFQDTADLMRHLTQQNNDLIRAMERLRQSQVRQRRILVLIIFVLLLSVVYLLTHL